MTTYYNDATKQAFTEFCDAYADITPASAIQFAKDHRVAIAFAFGAPLPACATGDCPAASCNFSASQTMSLISLAHVKIAELLKTLENPSQ